MATRHNHPALPFNALAPPESDCLRCAERRADRAAEGITDHNHELLPFGRRVPRGQCPRCDELHNGAPPREGALDRVQRLDDERSADMRAHFATGHDQRCSYMGPGGSGVCVYGDY